MIPPTLVHFIHHHLYLVWGIVVVGGIFMLTGVLTPSIVGYSAGVAIKIVYEKVFGDFDDQVHDRRHISQRR